MISDNENIMQRQEGMNKHVAAKEFNMAGV